MVLSTSLPRVIVSFQGHFFGHMHCLQFIVGQDIMETWRLRTPNEWDSFKIWSDVLIWRNQVYNIVINAFKDLNETNPQLYQLGYRDKAWTINK